MTTLVLCDRRSHVEHARRQLPGAHIVATTPEAAWTCERLGLDHDTVDACSTDAELNALGEATTRREYEWARRLDVRLHAELPEVGALGFEPARASLYWLKRTLDNIVLPARIVQDLVAARRPDRVLVFARDPFVPGFDALHPVRPLYALVAPAVLSGRTDVEVIDGVPPGPTGEGSSSPAGSRLTVARVSGRLRRDGDRLVRRARNPRRPRYRLVWAGPDHYDMHRAIPYLQAEGAAVEAVPIGVLDGRGDAHRRAARELARVAAAAWERIASDPETWTVTDDVSSGLRPVAAPFLRGFVTGAVPRAWASFLSVRDWLARLQPDALFAIEVQTLAGSAALEAARSLSVPRVAALHNPPGGAMDLPMEDAIGRIQCDTYLVNGSGDEQYFTWLAPRLGTFPRADVVVTGSARLDDLARRRPPAARRRRRREGLAAGADAVVLYVPTALLGAYRYFCEGHISDIAYTRLLRRVFEVFAGAPSVRVVYKPFPTQYEANPVEQQVRELVPNLLVSSEPLTELMWAVDAVVVDFPSTAVCEVVLTDAPLVVYAGADWARLQPAALDALRRRARVSVTTDDFVADVRRLVTSAPDEWYRSDDATFRRLYGTHVDDGRSAERAAEAILAAAAGVARSRRGLG